MTQSKHFYHFNLLHRDHMTVLLYFLLWGLESTLGCRFDLLLILPVEFNSHMGTNLMLISYWCQTGSAGCHQHCEPPGGFSFAARMVSSKHRNTYSRSMLINKWNRGVYLNHRRFLGLSSSLTALDWIALKSFPFCLSTTCQNCISGARPGGIMFNSIFKNSFLSSIPSLWASQPPATDRRRVSGSRSSFWRAAPFMRRIGCQSSVSGSF